MGIPLMRTKTWAYASGAFFGGVAGAYYAVVKSGTFPDDFYFNISVFILCMVILGGMGNVWGVIAGAAFLAYLNKFGPRQHRRLDRRAHPRLRLPPEHRRAALRLGHLRRHHRRRDALPARGPAALATPRAPSCTRRSRTTSRSTTSGTRAPDATRTNVLVTEGLRKEFGGLVAVGGVDFTVPRGKVVSLIGPNGAGKTTFFNMLTGVYKPTAGPRHLPRRGRDRQAAARDHRARRRPDLPEHPPLPEHDDARERARRDARRG